MATMTAFQLVEWGQPAEFREVEVPRPGAGEVLVKVAGVGLCHTDVHFLAPESNFGYATPFTLGHETGGWVEELGQGTTGFELGDAVVAVGIHSCGRCYFCVRGHDNYCPSGSTGRGYGLDGGLAQFVVVPARELIKLTALDPARAAPLTDAGVTSYHAVKKVLPKLAPGQAAVVIGVGGLGGYAVQYLRRFSAARVIAVDVAPHRLAGALELGAHDAVISDDSTAAAVRELAPHGAAAVLDFVGTDDTMRLALACGAAMGSIGIVGAGGGSAPIGWGLVPLECDVFIPQGGTIADLRDVIALAEAGEIRVDVELFPFAETAETYAKFAAWRAPHARRRDSQRMRCTR